MTLFNVYHALTAAFAKLAALYMTGKLTAGDVNPAALQLVKESLEAQGKVQLDRAFPSGLATHLAVDLR